MNEFKVKNGLIVDGDTTLRGGIYDVSGSTGTSGQLLSSTPNGVLWVSGNSATPTNYDFIDFNTGYTATAKTGRVYYDTTENALSYFPTTPNMDVTLNIGQESLIRVYNNSGAQIDNGSVVHISGSSLGLPTIVLSNAAFDNRSEVAGVATHDIPNNSIGFITNFGIVRDVNTSAFNVGDELYLSDTISGGFTNNVIGINLSSRVCSVGWVVTSGVTDGKILVSITNEIISQSLTNKEVSVLLGNTISTGVFEFTGLTKTSNTTFQIAPVRGWFVDNTTNPVIPYVLQVNYSGSTTGQTTSYLASSDATYVLLTSASTITLQPTFPTPQERRLNIYLGKVIHPSRTSILNVNNTVDFDVSPMSALRDLWTPIKLINDGIIVSPNGANLNINTTAGGLWGNGIGWTTNTLNPNQVSIAAKSPASFFYRTQTGGTSSSVTLIDPTKYDVGGAITSIGNANSDESTNQRVYLYPTGVINILYGQTKYTNLSAAVAGIQTETFVTYPNAQTTGVLIGIISVRNDIVADGQPLTNSNYAVFTSVSKFGELLGGTGGLSTTTLQQAYNNSTQPEILTNSTLGAVTFKRGSTSESDNVIEVQNNLGHNNFFVNGFGNTGINLPSTAQTMLHISGSSSFNPLLVNTSGGTTGLIVNNNGNVGIGTSNPISPLDIRSSNQNTTVNIINAGTPGLANSVAALSFANADSFSSTFTLSNGGITLNTHGNSSPFNVIGTLAVGSISGAKFAVKGDGATSSTTGLRVDDSNGVSSLIIRDNRRIGVGIDNPSAQFHISGNTSSSNPLLVNTSGGTTGLIVNNNGNVGIGTTSPLSKLNIASDTNLVFTLSNIDDAIAGSSSSPLSRSISFLGYNNNQNAFIRSDDMAASFVHSNLIFGVKQSGTSATEFMRIDGQFGNVGIGTANPSYKLQVNGDANGLYVIGANSAPFNQTIASFVYGGNNNSINVENQGGKASLQARDNVNGVMNLHINPVGGNVGIGTTTPFRTLDVVGGALFGSTQGAVEIGNSGHLGYIGGHNGIAFSTNHLNVGLASGEKVRITEPGNMGIGMSNPSAKLQVRGVGDTSSTTALRVENSGATPSMVVLDNGNVGIGVTSPSYKFLVQDASTGAPATVAAFRNSSVNSDALAINVSSGLVRFISTWESSGIDMDMAFTPTTLAGTQTEVMRIKASNGFVGIGTNSPVYKLDVRGNGYFSTNAGVRQLTFGDATNGVISEIGMINNVMSFYPIGGGTSAQTILANGNVGIGTTNPTYKLDVSTTGNTDGVVQRLFGDADYGATTSYSRGAFYKWDVGVGASATNNIPYSNFGIVEGTTLRFVIGVGGNVGIGTSIPSQTLDVNGDVRFRGDIFDSTNVSGTTGQVLISTPSGIQWSSSVNDTLNTKYDKSGGTISGDVTIIGNLTVNGTATTINTVNLLVYDPIIGLALSQSGTTNPTLDSGIITDRGLSGNTAFVWIENNKQYELGYTNNSYNDTNVTISQYGNLRLNNIRSNYITDSTNSTGITNQVLSTTSNGIIWNSIDGIITGVTSNKVIELGTGILSTVRICSNNIASGNYSGVLSGTGNTASACFSFVGGGCCNTASGTFSTVGGGIKNSALCDKSTVAGGSSNTASFDKATIGGGENNRASGHYSIIGGGVGNSASAQYTTVSGGYSNLVSSIGSTVGGGRNNTVTGQYSFLGGGRTNTASGTYSFIGTGIRNIASGCFSGIISGSGNSITNCFSFIGSGCGNAVSGIESAIVSGEFNTSSGNCSFIGGGAGNTSSGQFSSVIGGNLNTASGYASFIGGSGNKGSGNWSFTAGLGNCNSSRNGVIAGGWANTLSGYYSVIGGGRVNVNIPNSIFTVIGGGFCNQIIGNFGFIGGGSTNLSSTGSTVSGGVRNTASGCYSSVSGGLCNVASGACSFVGGGFNVRASGGCSTVSGGYFNTASGNCSFVGSGNQNTTSGSATFVGGGIANTASGSVSAVGGGAVNLATSNFSFVGGGCVNTASNLYSFVGGGRFNIASGGCSVVAGGDRNRVSECFSGIVSGSGNTSSGSFSFIGGGCGNTSSSSFSFIGGGVGNIASSSISTIGGGKINTASAYATSVFAGVGNVASNNAAIVGGGYYNTASGRYASIFAGQQNISSGWSSFIGNGFQNCVTTASCYSFIGSGFRNLSIGDYSFIGGGSNNFSSTGSTVGGGFCNISSNCFSVVGGGCRNTASNIGSTVGGGRDNLSSGNCSSVSGGAQNTASGNFSAIPAGVQNTASGYSSVVGGGYGNISSASYATIGGGFNNTNSGNFSTLSGGYCNLTSGIGGFVGGGCRNSSFAFSVVSGGRFNNSLGCYSGIVSGSGNTVTNNLSFIGSGCGNTVSGLESAIVGGEFNTASGGCSFIGGGTGNQATAIHSTVTGGVSNRATNNSSFVGGGVLNTSSGDRSGITAGQQNIASGNFSFIGGGRSNITSDCSVVAGGCANTASGSYSFIGGGRLNVTSSGSTVGGGEFNTASGNFSFIGGGRLNTTSFNNTFILGSNITANAVDTTFTQNFNSCGQSTLQGTSATAGCVLLVRNSTPLSLFTVQNNGQQFINSNFTSTANNTSGVLNTQTITQRATQGDTLTGTYINPTLITNQNNQTNKGLSVYPLFTGSTNSWTGTTNIIADFGAINVGTQLSVTDTTTGVIYGVNDVSGLPIIDATSNWDVNIYDFPNVVLSKTGKTLTFGVAYNSASTNTFQSDIILDERIGLSHRMTQVSGSTTGGGSAVLFNLPVNTGQTVYMEAKVSGRANNVNMDTIIGDYKYSAKRSLTGSLTPVGSFFSFVNKDNLLTNFAIDISGNNLRLVVTGNTDTYIWGSTITTQVF